MALQLIIIYNAFQTDNYLLWIINKIEVHTQGLSSLHLKDLQYFTTHLYSKNLRSDRWLLDKGEDYSLQDVVLWLWASPLMSVIVLSIKYIPFSNDRLARSCPWEVLNNNNEKKEKERRIPTTVAESTSLSKPPKSTEHTLCVLIKTVPPVYVCMNVCVSVIYTTLFLSSSLSLYIVVTGKQTDMQPAQEGNLQ